MRFRARCTTYEKKKLKMKEALTAFVVFSCISHSSFHRDVDLECIQTSTSLLTDLWIKAGDIKCLSGLHNTIGQSGYSRQQNQVRFRKALEDKIASVKICKIKKTDSGKFLKEAVALEKMEVSRRVR